MIEKKIITMEQQEISYSAALAELEEILRTIEAGEADIDTLSSKVTRATELIKLCRARLTKVESQVKEILEG
jgi:exodeoxyribonuclease VII small subunit